MGRGCGKGLHVATLWPSTRGEQKVAQAGDAAVPAVREFAATHGKDALPAAMVEAIVDLGGNGEAVLALLTDWASDRDFYWRAQAMKGLAVRSKEPLLGARFRQLFAAHEQDAAWLMRVYAQLGFALAEKVQLRQRQHPATWSARKNSTHAPAPNSRHCAASTACLLRRLISWTRWATNAHSSAIHGVGAARKKHARRCKTGSARTAATAAMPRLQKTAQQSTSY